MFLGQKNKEKLTVFVKNNRLFTFRQPERREKWSKNKNKGENKMET